MKRTIRAFAALGAVLSLAVIAPSAEAGPRFHSHGYHGHGHYAGGYGHRGGRGYWRGGRWIGLGLAVPLIAGAAYAADRDCYWEYGRRYCDY